MEIVNTLDIDGNRWEITDPQARQDIADLSSSSEQRFTEINVALGNKADKSYVDQNFATKNEAVKNEVTTTTFINSNNRVYKQGKMCTATIMNMLLSRQYNSGETLGYIGNPAFYPRDGIRGLIVQLNSGQASEVRINPDGAVVVGQAVNLTAGYWIGNFSWVTN